MFQVCTAQKLEHGDTIRDSLIEFKSTVKWL